MSTRRARIRCLHAPALLYSRFGPRSAAQCRRSFRNVFSASSVSIVHVLRGSRVSGGSALPPPLRCLQCSPCRHCIGVLCGLPQLSRATVILSLCAVSTPSTVATVAAVSPTSLWSRAFTLSKVSGVSTESPVSRLPGMSRVPGQFLQTQTSWHSL